MKREIYTRIPLLICIFALLFGSVNILQGQHGDITPSGIDANLHPKFVNPLPIPAEIDATQGSSIGMNMKQVTQWLGVENPAGNPLLTTVWGYGPGNNVTYPGPTIRAKKDKAVNITWKNKLPYNHLLPVDYSR